jgi:hypothetical protein
MKGVDVAYIVLLIILIGLSLAILIVLSLEYNQHMLSNISTRELSSSSSETSLTSLSLPNVNEATKIYADIHKAVVLVLGCIDYRLIDYLVNNMTERYDEHFDLVVMAGSELFVVEQSKSYYPSFNVTFFENVQIAIDLHHIQRVVAVSHEDCGAYKVRYGDDDCEQRHIDNLKLLGDMIKSRYNLPFDGYYLRLDSTMDKVVLVE